MLEDARARRGFFEGPEGTNAAVVDQHQLARIDLAQIARADHVERDSFRREDRRLAELAHHQGSDAERIAAGDQPLLS